MPGMTQLVPVPQARAIWPARRGAPRDRAAGEGWVARCPRCAAEGPTGPGGGCRSCAAALVPAMSVLPEPQRRPGLPSVFQRDLLELLPPWVAVPVVVLGRSVLVLFFLLVFWPVGVALLFTAVRDARTFLFPEAAPEGTHHHSPQFRLENAWVDTSRLRGRRGLVIQYAVQTHGLIHKRLELAVRVRGPDGRYLPGLLRRYRGDYGEVLVRHATKPLKSQSARFPRLWVFLPLRALPIPAAVQRMTVTVEAAFACQGKLLAESHLPYAFVPAADDRTPLGEEAAATDLDDAPAPADAIVLIDGGGPAEAISCGVCGDALAGEPVVRCALCESASHSECWEYMQGCSTYACEGRPA